MTCDAGRISSRTEDAGEKPVNWKSLKSLVDFSRARAFTAFGEFFGELFFSCCWQLDFCNNAKPA